MALASRACRGNPHCGIRLFPQPLHQERGGSSFRRRGISAFQAIKKINTDFRKTFSETKIVSKEQFESTFRETELMIKSIFKEYVRPDSVQEEINKVNVNLNAEK